MATSTTLSRAEVKRRRQAAQAAEASLRLEGLTMSESAKALQERWIAGELDEEEVMELTKANLLAELSG